MDKKTLYLVSLQTIVYQEVTRFMRIWVQTLIPPVITITLYFIIFGNLIGPRIGEMAGISYMQFMVPGLIMMSIITNSYSNVVSSFFSKRFQNSIEEVLVSPVPHYIILAGYTIGGITRGCLIGVIVSAVSLLFTDMSVSHPLLMILVVILTATFFSLAGFINSIFARNFDDISIIPIFVLTPMTYLGGVFYSIQLLPEVWQTLSLLNPILYMVNAFRYSVLGVADVNVYKSIAFLLVFNILAATYCNYLLRKGVGIKK